MSRRRKLVVSSADQPKTFPPKTSGGIESEEGPRRRCSMEYSSSFLVPTRSQGNQTYTSPNRCPACPAPPKPVVRPRRDRDRKDDGGASSTDSCKWGPGYL